LNVIVGVPAPAPVSTWNDHVPVTSNLDSPAWDGDAAPARLARH